MTGRVLHWVYAGLFNSLLQPNLLCFCQGLPSGSVIKNPSAYAGDASSLPGLVRSPGKENGNPLQFSCLGNPIDRGTWGGYSPWGHKESHLSVTHMRVHTHTHTHTHEHMNLYLKNLCFNLRKVDFQFGIVSVMESSMEPLKRFSGGDDSES